MFDWYCALKGSQQPGFLVAEVVRRHRNAMPWFVVVGCWGGDVQDLLLGIELFLAYQRTKFPSIPERYIFFFIQFSGRLFLTKKKRGA